MARKRIKSTKPLFRVTVKEIKEEALAQNIRAKKELRLIIEEKQKLSKIY